MARIGTNNPIVRGAAVGVVVTLVRGGRAVSERRAGQEAVAGVAGI